MNETYARGDTYAGGDAYGRDDAYAGDYGQGDGYAQGEGYAADYGQGDGYAQGEGYAADYGQGDGYGQGDVYGQGDAYGQGNAYAGDYGQGDEYGQDVAYGQGDAYGEGDEFARARAQRQRPARLGAYAREQEYVFRDPRRSGGNAKERKERKERKGAAGGLIIALVAVFSAVVVLVGLGYASQAGERRRVLLAEGDCVPVASLNTRGLDCELETQLAQQYRQMIAPVNQQMKTYVAAYAASELHNLTAAKGVLTGELGVENSFESNLKKFPFPPVFSSATNKLIADNEALIKLTTKQEQSSTLVQLQSFDSRIQTAMNAVRADLPLVGKDLDKHPTPNEFIGNGG